MNKGSNNHYSLLLQDETETDGIGLEEEEEDDDAEADINGMEEEDDDDDEDEDEDEDPVEESDEEEIFSSSKHRTLSHEGANLNGQNHIGGHGNEYRLLNNNDADLKAVIDTPITIWTPTPMSPARRACFIASIMFGILMVATFLWVLPCDVQPCEGDIGMENRDWAVKIEGMGINQTRLVRRLSGGHNVLLSYYTSNNISGWQTDNTTSEDYLWKSGLLVTGCNNCGEGDEGIGGANDIIGDGQCGLLMLDGNLGREIWRSPLRECPIDMQCDLLDVSGDHLPDCIVRGSYSMMFMIETRYGSIIWHLHQHQEAEAIHKTRPPATVLNPGPAILLPDINNDTYGDLLFWGSLSYQSSPSWNSEYTDSELWSSESDTPSSGNSQPLINNLILVCGQSGNILGKPLVLKQCQKLLSLALEGQLVTYICQELNGEVNRMSPIPLISLLHQILGSSVPVEKSLPYDNGLSYSPVVHGKRSNSCVVSVYYNKRPCPICQSRVILSSDNVIHWNRTYEHSSVVSWASLLSNNECHGAILKIWEYKHTATVVKTAKPPSLGSKRSIRTTQATEEENLETAAADVENDGLDLNFGTSMNSSSGESKKMSALFHKKNIVNMFEDPSDENGDPVSSKSSDSNYENKRTRRKQQKEGIDNSPDLYEHPTIHRHKGKLASGTHDEPNHISESYVNKFESVPDKWPTHRKYPLHPKQVLSTSASIPSTFPSGARTMPPDVLAPPGYQLQHIHEQISVLKFNGSVWYEDTLTSIGITQLCRDQTNCIPDTKSHCKSVAVNPGLNERTWQLVTTSTTFVNSPSSGEEHHSAPWTLTSIVRKIILTV